MLKEARLKLGLSQQSLADKLHMSQGDYSQYETRGKAVPRHRIGILAKVLGLDELALSIWTRGELTPGATAKLSQASAETIAAWIRDLRGMGL